jgi:putative transposase
MTTDIKILPFQQSNKIDDPLTEIARDGARRMLAQALTAEADAFVASYSDERLDDGRQL